MTLQIDEYVHRIGRTGRAGNTGTSISFFDPSKDNERARALVKILSDAQQVTSYFICGVGGLVVTLTGMDTMVFEEFALSGQKMRY